MTQPNPSYRQGQQVVMTDNLATVVESAIERVIGSLPMTTVDLTLRHTLALESPLKARESP